MTTVGDLIETVYDLLLGGRRAAAVNTLYGAITDTATQIKLGFPTTNTIRIGDVLEVDDEHMLNVGVAFGATPVIPGGEETVTVFVLRGYEGTTAAAHAANALVRVNPVLSQRTVRNALRNEILSLTPALFAVDSYDTTTVDGQDFYPLSGAIDDASVLGLVGCFLGSESGGIDDWARPQVRFVRNLPSDGLGLMGVRIIDRVTGGRPLRIQVATRFNTDDLSSTVDIEDIGLDPAWEDIVTFGAAAKLAGRTEFWRELSDRVSGGQVAQVQAGARANAASWFRKQATDARQRAALDLRGRFPWMTQT